MPELKTKEKKNGKRRKILSYYNYLHVNSKSGNSSLESKHNTEINETNPEGERISGGNLETVTSHVRISIFNIVRRFI